MPLRRNVDHPAAAFALFGAWLLPSQKGLGKIIKIMPSQWLVSACADSSLFDYIPI